MEDSDLLLEPYVDQVSGHSCLFQHGGVVFKPLYPREHHFYEHMPQDMRQFTPAYMGTADVKVENEAENQVVFMTRQENIRNNGSHSRCHHGHNRRTMMIRRCTNESIDVTLPQAACDQPAVELISSPQGGATCLQANHVFWNFKLLRKLLQKYNGTPQKFLVLENLTRGLTLPCVMDIKMGTRQHSDEATEQKRINQIRKCRDTTSSSLGIRICGMKVYHEDGPHNIWCDKYYGRTLSKAGVEDLLRQFLSNGRHFRQEIAQQILAKLKHIRNILTSKNDFRFYSSSLLITYEGQEGKEHAQRIDKLQDKMADCDLHLNNNSALFPSGESEGEALESSGVGVHLVDFELITHKDNSKEQWYHSGPDQGMLFGLNSLIAIFERFKQS